MRKIFTEFINADDDFSILRPGQRINANNIRVFSTDKGATGRVEAVGGTALIFSALPAGTNYCLGGCPDSAKKRILFANYNSNGNHGIYCYDKLAGTTYTVLLSSQVEGGLNFSKYMRIDANAKVIDDLFVFTDNNNETRKINTEAGIKLNQPTYATSVSAYATPIKYTTITLIKRPPIYNLTVAKRTDSGYDNNLLTGQAFQFLYQYRYKDNEISALSAHSKLVPINAEADTYNAIDVTVPFNEYIDDDIYAIDIVVKYGNNGKKAVVKSWDKDSDAAAIDAHNAGTAALTFTFYNDVQGDFLDNISADSDEDEVPILTKTIELAKDRLHFGYNKVGYTTPSVSSLAATVGTMDTGSAGTYTANWKYIELSYVNTLNGTVSKQEFYYAYQPTLSPNICYYYDTHQTPIAPASLNVNDATAVWNTETNLAYYIMRNVPPPIGTQWTSNPAPYFVDTGQTTNLIVGAATLATLKFFKSNSRYKVSISFSDRFKRKCGVVKKYVSVTIPVRTYNQSVFSSIIAWTLSNTNAINEIPDWAYYYTINITPNQTTTNFVQIYAPGSSYVTVDNAGAYTFLQEAFVSNKYHATAFDLTQLSAAGLGYSYTDGDELILYKSDGTHEIIPVIDTYGKYVFTKPTDIGDLSSNPGFVIEIYTPYKQALTNIFYETGDVYAITNPGTTSRTYSVLSGQIDGDCYAIERDKGGSSIYFTETMSPNDKYWKDWEKDLGWANEIDSIGQKILKNSIFFSNTYVSGTKNNGLNKVSFTSEVDLDGQNGPIQKLQLANKIQYDGTVLLAICQNETVSCYLGEQEWLDTNGNPYLAKSDNVIGTTRPLQGSLGTSNPESVFEYNGLVFWWDIINGCAVQYSSNGLFPISKNKLVRAAKLFSNKFASLSQSDIAALGSNPFIIGGFDPYHKEVLYSIPSTEATPPKGNLVDFPNVVYPYDIYDGKGKTLMYNQQLDGWEGSMSFEAEMFMRLDNDLYSFKNGSLYIHNQADKPAYFYGTQYKANIMFAVNPGGIHTFKAIGLESNKFPEWVHLATEDPYTQSSDLPYAGLSDFKDRQGVIEASIMRDRFSPNAVGDYDAKEITGDRLLGKALLVDLQYEFVNDPTLLQLRAVNIGSTLNIGTLINK